MLALERLVNRTGAVCRHVDRLFHDRCSGATDAEFWRWSSDVRVRPRAVNLIQINVIGLQATRDIVFPSAIFTSAVADLSSTFPDTQARSSSPFLTRAVHSEAMAHSSMTVTDEYVREANKKRIAVDIARAINRGEDKRDQMKSRTNLRIVR
ncbi:hypothetical protein [Mesorhizobium sp. INR15]|uniref:hypothetical protein n=1 Tax=Mesorhizobium sp. INR15 TaxID=2654248 RepID=UPI0021566433|nr:hypothetical protein [Mesorhizobium sp. INR15]